MNPKIACVFGDGRLEFRLNVHSTGQGHATVFARLIADKLGIDAESLYDGQLLQLTLRDGVRVLVYPKDDFKPATYTVLNFPVPDIDKAVDDLAQGGITFDRYEGFDQDAKGIARSDGNGPDIAWFKDPDGNIIAVHSDEGP